MTNFSIQDFMDLSDYATNITNDEILQMNGWKKFDVCISNPPFSNHPGDGLYAKFLNKYIDIVDGQIVSVNPEGALIGHGSGSLAKYAFKQLRQSVDKYYVEIEMVDKSLFAAAIKSETCIVCIDKNKEHTINVDLNGHKATFEKQADINTFFMNDYLVEFDRNIKEFMKTHESVEEHMKLTKGYGDFVKQQLKENNPDESKLYAYFMKPNASYAYATLKKDGLEKPRQYDEKDQNKSLSYVCFEKDEYYEASNFLNFMSTEFVKLCICYSWKSSITNINKYSIIPWLDWFKSYSDEELFEMIGMKYDKKQIDKLLIKI